MKRSNELEQWIKNFYDHLLDVDFVENNITNTDALLGIGSEENEWLEGREFYLKVMSKQAEIGQEIGMAITESNPTAYVQNDVGWWNDQITVTAQDNLIGMRVTGVARKEDGDWKMVQGHFSIGIPNEEAGFGDVDIMDV